MRSQIGKSVSIVVYCFALSLTYVDKKKKDYPFEEDEVLVHLRKVKGNKRLSLPMKREAR